MRFKFSSQPVQATFRANEPLELLEDDDDPKSWIASRERTWNRRRKRGANCIPRIQTPSPECATERITPKEEGARASFQVLIVRTIERTSPPRTSVRGGSESSPPLSSNQGVES